MNYLMIGFSYLVAGFVAPLFYAVPVWSYAGTLPSTSSPPPSGVSAGVWSLSHVCVAAFDRQLRSPDHHPVRFYAPAIEK